MIGLPGEVLRSTFIAVADVCNRLNFGGDPTPTRGHTILLSTFDSPELYQNIPFTTIHIIFNETYEQIWCGYVKNCGKTGGTAQLNATSPQEEIINKILFICFLSFCF